MYNVANKIILISAVATALSCCNSDSQHKQADRLLEEASGLLEADAPDSALVLLDSLDKSFPTLIEIRRQAMAVRANAMTASLEKRIFKTDSLIIVYQAEADRLMPLFEHIDVPGANGYFYLKGAFGPDISKTGGVQARLSDVDFSYYIVAANSGDKIGISQITLSSPEGSLTSAEIPESDSRRGDSDLYGSDFASFSTSESDTLGAWSYKNGNIITSVTISGNHGSKDIALSGPKAQQFGNVWHMGVIGAKLKAARQLKEKLERQIIIARDHAANLMPDPSSDE